MKTEDKDFSFMAPEVFEGALGHLIFLQEFPSLKGEEYVRIFFDMNNAEELCSQIMAIARKARQK